MRVLRAEAYQRLTVDLGMPTTRTLTRVNRHILKLCELYEQDRIELIDGERKINKDGFPVNMLRVKITKITKDKV